MTDIFGYARQPVASSGLRLKARSAAGTELLIDAEQEFQERLSDGMKYSTYAYDVVMQNRKYVVITRDLVRGLAEAHNMELVYFLENKPLEDSGGPHLRITKAWWKSKSATVVLDMPNAGLTVLALDGEEAEKLAKEFFDALTVEREAPEGSISVMTVHSSGFGTYQVALKPRDLSLDLQYSDGFEDVYRKTVEFLRGDDNGACLFHGPPGTGKTSFLRHLVKEVSNKEFIYISAGMVDRLSSPDMVGFLAARRGSGIVLVVEDAEKVLRKRDSEEGNQVISSLLNLTDGFLAEVCRCQMILTFNCPRSEVDEAILRKGRLRVDHKFEPLSVAKSNALLKSLGREETATAPMTLADIYNIDSDTGYTPPEPKVMGFHS